MGLLFKFSMRKGRHCSNRDSLDSLFDEYFEDKTNEEKAEIKRKYGTRQSWQRKRIQRVCMDIIKHYKNHIL